MELDRLSGGEAGTVKQLEINCVTLHTKPFDAWRSNFFPIDRNTGRLESCCIKPAGGGISLPPSLSPPY